MQFLTSLFGGSGSTILTSVFALGVVLVLIFLALWVLKLIFRASGSVGRGRNRRLTVVDSLALDPKRQLLIIRRDNVEHLIMVGGAQELVIESGFGAEEIPAATRRPVPTVPARPVPKPVAKPAAAAPVAPAPMKPATPVVTHPPAPVPVAPPVAANSVTALDRLRDLNKPGTGRRSVSLRHTGLMRPVSQPAVTENPAGPVPDSGKEVINAPSGQTEFGDPTDIERNDGYTADRN